MAPDDPKKPNPKPEPEPEDDDEDEADDDESEEEEAPAPKPKPKAKKFSDEHPKAKKREQTIREENEFADVRLRLW